MLKVAAAGSQGGRDDDGESETLSPQTAPQAGETARAASARARAAKVNTARDDAEVVLKELGVERLAKTSSRNISRGRLRASLASWVPGAMRRFSCTEIAA